MGDQLRAETGSIAPPGITPGEAGMVRRQVWEEIRREHEREGTPIAALARAFGLDRKTVRRCLRQEALELFRGYPDRIGGE